MGHLSISSHLTNECFKKFEVKTLIKSTYQTSHVIANIAPTVSFTPNNLP